jgi:ABC-type multidrug transport system fused ATPase/permease subunit
MNFKQTLGFFWHYLKAYKIQSLVILIAIAVSTYFSVLAPRYLGRAIEALVNYLTDLFTTGEASLSEFHQVLWMLLFFYLFMKFSIFRFELAKPLDICAIGRANHVREHMHCAEHLANNVLVAGGMS